jgi:cobalt-zinc-cadmium efflux system outer membrane protein
LIILAGPVLVCALIRPASFAAEQPKGALVTRLPSDGESLPQPPPVAPLAPRHQPPETIPPGAPLSDAAAGLTLAELESIALQNNPTLVQAQARIQAAQGRWVQGGLRPNPIVGYQASEVGNEGRAGQQGAFYSQQFVRGGKLALNQTAASREVAQARQLVEAQRLRVVNDVRIEFFNVLVAQRALELTRELVKIGRHGVEATEHLFKGEQVGKSELLQARIEVASAGIALRNAQNRHATAWRRLSSVVGTPDMQPQSLRGELLSTHAEFNWDNELNRILAQSPELASAWAGVARAQAIVRRAQVEATPNVDLQVGLQYDNASQYTIGNVQLGMPIPFRNRNQGNIQTAFADLRIAQADVARIQLDLRNRLAQAFENYANARNQFETLTNEILPSSQSSLELVLAAYRAGQVSFLTLLTAQRTFAQANLAYLQAVQELNASRVAIEGMLLTGSLQLDTAPLPIPRLMEAPVPVFGPGRAPVEQN